MIKDLLILGLLLFVVFVIFIYYKFRNEYHDPPDGTIYTYDEPDSEFSASHIDYPKAKKRTELLNELIDGE